LKLVCLTTFIRRNAKYATVCDHDLAEGGELLFGRKIQVPLFEITGLNKICIYQITVYNSGKPCKVLAEFLCTKYTRDFASLMLDADRLFKVRQDILRHV
jgi:hypothetical protein